MITRKAVFIVSRFIYGSEYKWAESKEKITTTNKYVLSGKYDGENVVLFENNNKYSNPIKNSIKQSNLNMILGANPNLGGSIGTPFNGNMYAARIYNRALTDEEILHNQRIDMERYGVVIEEAE